MAYDPAGNSASSGPVWVAVENREPVDTSAPIVWITAPEHGDIVSGSVAVSVSATDAVGVAVVDLYLDGGFLARDASAPFAFGWNSEAAANGPHDLTAVAYDAAGNAGTSPVATVTSRNSPDPGAPDVSVTSPVSGRNISNTVQIRVRASDDRRIERVEVYVDGARIGSKTCGLSSCAVRFHWRARREALGAHEISARAVDDEGNVATSASVTVYETR